MFCWGLMLNTFNLANSIGYSVGSWPIKYLWLSLGRNPLKADFLGTSFD